MPNRSVVSPSRLTSPAMSPVAVIDSLNRLHWKLPSGAFQLWPPAVKVPPAEVTGVICARQVPSLSVIGSVAVTQSTILRSPVVVFCRAG